MTGAPLLSDADDGFHALPDTWWAHETAWFSFCVPERGLGGWLYGWIRPTIGVCGGGCYLWDPSTHVHWAAPYWSDHHNLRLPAERDLHDFTFPTGLRVRALEPLSRYAVSYRDADVIDLDLEFAAVMAPWVSVDEEGRPHHLDQIGRVTGSIVLRGERIDVDCLAIRDRTWSRRSERWREGGGYGYTFAAAEAGPAFLAVGSDEVRGFLSIGGTAAALRSGVRRVERDADLDAPSRVVVEARDEQGRDLEAIGEAVSRIAMPVPGVHGMVWTTLCRWTLNDEPAWGEDQEPWAVATWQARQRGRLTTAAAPPSPPPSAGPASSP